MMHGESRGEKLHLMVVRTCLCAVLVAAVAATAGAAEIYTCDFEEAEGFVLDPLNGQQSWIGNAAAMVNDVASSGQYGAQFTANGAYNGDMFVMGRRYFADPLPFYLVTISQDVMIDRRGEAAWAVAAYAGDELIHYVLFQWDGAIVVDGEATASSWTPQAWQNLTMDLDLQAGTGTVHLNGGLVSTLPLFGDSSLGIDNIIIFGDNYIEEDAASMFYDNLSITAIPEPATFALLGFGLIGFVVRRKKQEHRRGDSVAKGRV